MSGDRIAEIESELRTKMPYDDYDANSLTMILCDICNGATDDHKAGCVVPLVYELLNEVKRLSVVSNQRKGAGE